MKLYFGNFKNVTRIDIGKNKVPNMLEFKFEIPKTKHGVHIFLELYFRNLKKARGFAICKKSFKTLGTLFLDPEKREGI